MSILKLHNGFHISLILLFHSDCSETNSEKMIKVTSETEYFQRAYDAYAHYSEYTSFAFSFAKESKNVDVGLKVSGGISQKFSGKLGIDVSRTMQNVRASVDYEHKKEGKIDTFQNYTLQLVRSVVTTISIGGDTSRNEREDIMEPIPYHKRKNDTWLREHAFNEMMTYYEPNETDIPNKNIALFEQSACAFGMNYQIINIAHYN